MDPFTWLLKQFQEYKVLSAKFGSKKLKAIIADTPEKRMIGLMYVGRLLADECMVFIFDGSDRYGIWMRNMRFPIDVIWLDEQMRVVDVAENLQPMKGLHFKTYKPENPALYVVETNSGFVKKNRITNRTKVILELPQKKIWD